MLFHREQRIDQRTLPFDDISLPTKAEHISAFFIDEQSAKAPHLVRVSGGQPGLLIDVTRSDGHPIQGGIGFIADGHPTLIADLQLRINVGKYPTLIVTAVPQPFVMACALLAFIGGTGSVIRQKLIVDKA